MYFLFQFPGLAGLTVGLFILPAIWWIVWLALPPGRFEMDFGGEKGSFVPLFSAYLDIAKLVIGLSSGSIAALVGTAVFRSQGGSGQLLITYASPLFLLAFSIIWGVFFMPFLATDYEAYRHRTLPYTRLKYSKNQAFGFSCLICFALGYLWLIFIVIRQH